MLSDSKFPPVEVLSEKIRVLQIGKFYSPQRGGIESHLKTLCECLMAQFSLEVLVSNNTTRTIREVFEGVPVTRAARICQLNSTPINLTMPMEIRSRSADIVHLHWPNPMAAIAYLISGHRGKLVVTYHCDVVRQRLMRRLFNPLLQVLLRRAQAIVVSSQVYLNTSSVLTPHRDRCHVIPFGVHSRFFSKPAPDAISEIHHRFGTPLILSVGRFVDYKGLNYLIRAISNTTGRLVLVGQGPLMQRLVALTRSLHLQDRVVFLGAQSESELCHLYQAADLFVLTSTDRSEAFGLVQVEAMAAGVAVINTALNSGTTSVSVSGVTGLTVPHSDVSALTKAINCLLEDTPLRLKFGGAARVRAEQLFTATTMAARISDLYHQVLSGQ